MLHFNGGSSTLSYLVVILVVMPSPYARWMYNWETRLTSVDNNRVVRPLEWGIEWTRDWPCRNGFLSPKTADECEHYLREYNRRAVAASDEFFSYKTPADFRIEKRQVQVFSTREIPDEKIEKKIHGTHAEFLRFTSPVRTQYPENNLANARWFPAKGSPAKNKSALVMLPQWNSDALSHNGLARILNRLGISVLRLSMPYHDIRRPAEIRRADYAVSANIGRTLDATRQGVIDVRCCLDWLQAQGYERLGMLGTSLGSCYAFLAASHDPRIKVVAFNHASTYVADVVWHGQSTRHIRQGIEPHIDLERLRGLWTAISPMSYFEQFARFPRRSLIVYAKYDLTFLPEFSQQVVSEFQRRKLHHKVVALPCGHYSIGEAPYRYLDGWCLASFLGRAFKNTEPL